MLKEVFFIVAVLFPAITFSQIVIDQSDMPQPDDTIRQSSAIETGSINYQATGSNFIWDFSQLVPLSQKVDTFVTVQQTPLVYQFVFFLSANLASPGQNFDQLPGFQVTDYYNYYENSSSEYKSVGFGISLNGLPIPNKFDDPDIMYRFPLTMGDVDSSFSSFNLSVPGLGYYGGWKKRLNQVDGWGELITPYGSFETIRLRSDIIQYDSLYIDSLGFGLPVLRNYIEYKWLGKDFGIPLCYITDDGLLPTIDYIDSVRNLSPISNVSLISNKEISIHPNPFHDRLVVNFPVKSAGEAVFRFINIHGTEVELRREYLDNPPNIQSFVLTGLNLHPGLYILDVQLNNQHYFHKIVKK